MKPRCYNSYKSRASAQEGRMVHDEAYDRASGLGLASPLRRDGVSAARSWGIG